MAAVCCESRTPVDYWGHCKKQSCWYQLENTNTAAVARFHGTITLWIAWLDNIRPMLSKDRTTLKCVSECQQLCRLKAEVPGSEPSNMIYPSWGTLVNGPFTVTMSVSIDRWRLLWCQRWKERYNESPAERQNAMAISLRIGFCSGGMHHSIIHIINRCSLQSMPHQWKQVYHWLSE